MSNLNQQPQQSNGLQALSAIINTEVKKPSHRMKYQMVAFDMSIRLNHAKKECDHDMFTHFYERLLPVTLRDWMTRS